jgi:hypothetical protein
VQHSAEPDRHQYGIFAPPACGSAEHVAVTGPLVRPRVRRGATSSTVIRPA